MGRQQARNEQAVHYYVGLARDPGRRALGSPEFWARSAKGLPCAGGGLRATASRLPGCMSHVARRAGSTRGSRSTGQAPECRVPVLCRPMAQGPRPTAHWGSVNLEGIIVGTTHSVTTFFASIAPTVQWSRDTACLLLSRGSLTSVSQHGTRCASTPNPPPPLALVLRPSPPFHLPRCSVLHPQPHITSSLGPSEKTPKVRVVRSTYLPFQLPPPTTATTTTATTCILVACFRPKPNLALPCCASHLVIPMPALSCIPTLHSSSPIIASSNPLLLSTSVFHSRLAAVPQIPKPPLVPVLHMPITAPSPPLPAPLVPPQRLQLSHK
jgi:hypothetical protein